MKNINNKHQEVVEFLLEKVSKRTKVSLDKLTADTNLADVGIDSLNAVLLCGYLEEEYDLEIEPVIMFEYKTANEVADAICKMMEE
ncbi:acyl carrier protein [Halarcobacter sp.]|uniref:acyl carrier protein n=1 Tax=Halarcobacter sp. TaxID=2321133 RepID=UPI002AA74BB6|nr:acyl carrier protein [Halarcobacter sp.]